MMRRSKEPRLVQFRSGLLLLAAAAFTPLKADIVVLDFEGFPESTSPTNQYPDLLFSNTTVLTAGVSLNEFEFPPHSGTNMAFDDGEPISIAFDTRIRANSLKSRTASIAAALRFRMPSDHPPLPNCHAACRATTHCRESAYRQFHFWDRNLFFFHCLLLAQTTTFAETFNNAPNYANNWTIARHYGRIPLDNTAALRLVLASSLFDPIPSDLNVRYGGFAL
jgi:hypothetical protein